MKICLHIGVHKTASSRLQSEMMDRKAELADGHGVHAVSPFELRPFHAPLHWLQAALPIGLRASFPSDTRKRYGHAIETAQELGHATVAMSDENAPGVITNMLMSGRIYPAAYSRLSMIAPLLRGHDVTLTLVLRDYAGFFASLYAHRMKTSTLPAFSNLKPRFQRLPRRWPAVVRDIRRAIPGAQLRIWTLEEAAGRPDKFFQEVVDAPEVTPWGRNPVVNPSPSAEAVEALHALDANHARSHQHRKAVLERFPRSNGTRFWPWEDGEARVLRNHYEDDLERLSAHAGDGVTLVQPDADARYA